MIKTVRELEAARFTAKSGNTCRFKVIARSQKTEGIAVIWESLASPDDEMETDQWMNAETVSKVSKVVRSREEMDQMISREVYRESVN